MAELICNVAFDMLTKASWSMRLKVPIYQHIITLEEMTRDYPEFVNFMDGSEEVACLSFYYRKDPVNSAFEFLDDDAERDIADVLGINLDVCTAGESVEEEDSRKRIECLIELLNCLETESTESTTVLSKSERKAQKKERRIAKLAERHAV